MISVDQLAGMLVDLFIAGAETTSSILRWALLYLVNYPELQEQLYSSIKVLPEISLVKRYKKAKIRKRRNQKKIPTPKTEVGKNQTNNQVP